jgi:hypothetical protein
MSIYFHLLCMQVTGQDLNLVPRCRRVYSHAHDYHINSISNNRLATFLILWISDQACNFVILILVLLFYWLQTVTHLHCLFIYFFHLFMRVSVFLY